MLLARSVPIVALTLRDERAAAAIDAGPWFRPIVPTGGARAGQRQTRDAADLHDLRTDIFFTHSQTLSAHQGLEHLRTQS